MAVTGKFDFHSQLTSFTTLYSLKRPVGIYFFDAIIYIIYSKDIKKHNNFVKKYCYTIHLEFLEFSMVISLLTYRWKILNIVYLLNCIYSYLGVQIKEK